MIKLYSLIIVEQVLKEYHPTIQISDNNKLLKGITLSDVTGEDDLLHIYNEDESVICRNEDDFIVLPTDGLLDVVEKIVAFSDKLSAWRDDLLRLISEEASLKKIIDRSVSIMENPILVVDESSVVRAVSDHGMGEINSDWDYILENGCIRLETVENVFRTPQYKKQVRMSPNKPFYIKPSTSIGGINFRILSDIGQSYIGTLVILEGLNPITPAMMQYVTILADAIQIWFRINNGKLAMDSAQQVLEELLVSGGLLSVGENTLERFIEAVNGSYALIAVKGHNEAYLKPYLMNLAEILPNSVSCMVKDKLVVLTDAADCDLHAEKIQKLIKAEMLSLGISNAFTELDQAGTYLNQALIAMEYGSNGISKLDAEIMMRFISREAFLKISSINIVHPALSVLQKYDKRHHSEYYKTLYVFLITERSIVASLPHLCVHRNTLIFRLSRLSALINADLDEPAVREWILFSYRLCGVPEIM